MTNKIMLVLATVLLSTTVISRIGAQNPEELTNSSLEWYVTTCETLEGLKVGVGVVRSGMTIDAVYSALGDPQTIITPQMEEYAALYDGTILVYPDHNLYFKKGTLEDVKDRRASLGL